MNHIRIDYVTARFPAVSQFGAALLSTILVGLVSVGCSNPADDVPEAGVGAAEQEGGGADADATVYVISPESKINFVGSKVTGSHDGGFNEFSGELLVKGSELANAGHKVTIDTTSIWSDNERLTGHLKSADFFDVQNHPEATFVVTAIAPGESGQQVTGNLTLHGVTKSITFPATIEVAGDQASVQAEFFINRFDFDIKFAGKPDDLIRKEVVIKLDIKAAPKTATTASLWAEPAM